MHALLLLACASHHRDGGPPDLILVSFDTLRADHVGAWGYATGSTPNLDAFAAEAARFEHAYSQATQTLPSHMSMLTGRYPSEVTATDAAARARAGQRTLPQVLAAYGYDTAAFVAGGDLNPQRGPASDFATYRSSADFGSFFHTGRMATAWLAARDDARPAFVFVHGYDTHEPYVKPAPYGYLFADPAYAGPAAALSRTSAIRMIDGRIRASFEPMHRAWTTELRPRSASGRSALQLGQGPEVGPQDLAHARALYDGAASWADAWFGRMMADFQDLGLLDEAWIVVVSDHGEQLGEDGLFFHGMGLDDAETHVVLMVRPPGGIAGGRTVPALAELTDVLPTFAEVAGAVVPAGTSGLSLLPAVRGEPFAGHPFVHAQTSADCRTVSVRGPTGRLDYVGVPPASPYLADLVAAAALGGPGLTLADGLAVEDAEPVRAEMVRWTRGLAPAPDAAPAEVPPELEKALREHGYFGR